MSRKRARTIVPARRVRRRLNQWVTIVGPDGAGKSALVAALSEVTNVARHEHFRPFRRPSSTGLLEPHSKPLYGSGVALVKVLLLASEQWVAQFPRRRARSVGLFVQERGWWDQVADLRRYRMPSDALWLIRTLGRLLPRPDVLVLLVAPADVIHARKPELEEAEIERQTKLWTELGKTAKRGMLTLDSNSHAPPELAGQLVRALDKLK
jgi:hypothetical protein